MSEMNDIIKNGQLMPADLTARSAINTTTWTLTPSPRASACSLTTPAVPSA